MSTGHDTKQSKLMPLRGPHSRFAAARAPADISAMPVGNGSLGGLTGGLVDGLRFDRAATTARPVSLLLVDNQAEDVDRMLKMLAERFGALAQVHIAGTAREAFEILNSRPIDVVLTEYRLPDADGLGLVASIAARHPCVATVLVTAHGSESIAAAALKFGARDYLVKSEADAANLHRSILQAASKASADRQQSERLAELEQSRSDLDQIVRSLSHDMTAMFMLLDHSIQRIKDAVVENDAALQARPLAQQFAHVEACLRESKRFLDDLTTVARTGQIHMEPSRVDLAETVAEVLFEQREVLAERNVQVEVAQDLPAVWCNPFRVKQVITNLVRNAARHGCDTRQPRISILRWPSQGPFEAAFEWVAICDNGPGIPLESRQEIFEPGRRLTGAHPEGSGVGLSIVRKIVQHYGGQVFAAPTYGGATFVLSLPSAVSNAPIG